MKKVLALAVAMLLIPFTAFGLEMMSDGDMASITGQSGVAISIDNVQVYQETGGRELWFETKLGVNGEGAAAAVGLVYSEGSAQFLFLNKVSNPWGLTGGGSLLGTVSSGSIPTSNRLLRGNYEPLAAMSDQLLRQGMRLDASVLSIRVAQNNDYTSVFGPFTTTFAGSSYVEIGLPTLEIVGVRGNVQALQIYIVGDGAYDTSVGTLGPIGAGDVAGSARYSVGTLYTTDAGTTTTILGGRIGIAPLGAVPQQYTSSALDDTMAQTRPW